LTPGDYRIRVTLRGDNLKKPARLNFYVRNPGAGKLLTAAPKATRLVDGQAVSAQRSQPPRWSEGDTDHESRQTMSG
jgi:archaellum component FlaG (FlaF/FlaG flagellin family)